MSTLSSSPSLKLLNKYKKRGDEFSEASYNSEQLFRANRLATGLASLREGIGQLAIPSINKLLPLNMQKSPEDSLSGIDKATDTESSNGPTKAMTKQMIKELIGRSIIKDIMQSKQKEELKLPEIPMVTRSPPAMPRKKTEPIMRSRDWLLLQPVSDTSRQERKNIVNALYPIQLKDKEKEKEPKPPQRDSEPATALQRMSPRPKPRKHKKRGRKPKIEWDFARRVYKSVESDKYQQLKKELSMQANAAARSSLVVPVLESKRTSLN